MYEASVFCSVTKLWLLFWFNFQLSLFIYFCETSSFVKLNKTDFNSFVSLSFALFFFFFGVVKLDARDIKSY